MIERIWIIVAAVIVPKNGRAPDAGELQSHCLRNLAAYKLPKRYVFVAEEDLPLTTTGKIQKYVLRARQSAIAPQ